MGRQDAGNCKKVTWLGSGNVREQKELRAVSHAEASISYSDGSRGAMQEFRATD